MYIVRTAHLTIAALALAGCATTPPAATATATSIGTDAARDASHPLMQLSGQPIIVFPVQYVSFHDNLGFVKGVPNQAAFLSRLDDEIAYALTERGLAPKWTFAAEISRIAQRNSTVVSDPHALNAQSLLGKVDVGERLDEPLGSQIRSVLALKDGRFIILPVSLDIQNQGTMAVGVLRVVMVDARLANVNWVGEVRSDPLSAFSPALAASVASRFADLILPAPR
jgi:hypothetical protein